VSLILCDFTGDFNCPDVSWETGAIHATCPDHNIQQKLIDSFHKANVTQIHTSSTRKRNQLDLVFVSNSSLVKSPISVPGIYDDDMLVTDVLPRPVYVKQPARKFYQY